MTKKILLGLLLCAIVFPTTVSAKTETYNTPNTTTEDTDKKLECEVTADIHYAYYISLPAALTLEPWDFDKHYNDIVDLLPNKPTRPNSKNWYVCPYSIKAKAKTEGLGGKYIRVFPIDNEQALKEWAPSAPWPVSIENIDFNTPCKTNTGLYKAGIYLKEVISDKYNSLSGYTDYAIQQKIYFGANDSNETVGVDSTKWATINGIVVAELKQQGQYSGNFDFVYGLVDSIE